MQTEGLYYQPTDAIVPEQIASDGLSPELPRVPALAASRPEETHQGSALRGLLLAVPISISLWAAIGLSVWALLR